MQTQFHAEAKPFSISGLHLCPQRQPQKFPPLTTPPSKLGSLCVHLCRGKHRKKPLFPRVFSIFGVLRFTQKKKPQRKHFASSKVFSMCSGADLCGNCFRILSDLRLHRNNKYRKGNGMRQRNTRTHLVKDGNQCRQGRRWRGYFMYCEPAVSGRRCPGSMEAAVQYTEGFRNGWKLVSLKKSGARVWNSTMNWKGSAGSGKVWTAVW